VTCIARRGHLTRLRIENSDWKHCHEPELANTFLEQDLRGATCDKSTRVLHAGGSCGIRLGTGDWAKKVSGKGSGCHAQR
jgi:hypothetical protein